MALLNVALKNVLVLGSSAKAGTPRGSSFVLGKTLTIALTEEQAELIAGLEPQIKTATAEAYNVKERTITSKASSLKLRYNDEKETDFMYINFTKVPQDKEDNYLKDETGEYIENIINRCPDETGKVVVKMPTILLNGTEVDGLPYAGSVVDLDLAIRADYDEDSKELYIGLGLTTVTIVSAVEGQGATRKQSNRKEVDLSGLSIGQTSTVVKEMPKAKKATPKAETTADTSEVDEAFAGLV